MKTLNRLLLLALSVTLLAAAYAMHVNTTEIPIFHDTYYHIKYPWLLKLRHVSFFGVLIWCVLFARSEPAFVRVGLIAVIAAFAIQLLPHTILRDQIVPPSWH